MNTCHGVKLHATKTMREGERSWSVPSFSYYAGRKHSQLQTTSNHYAATLMSLALAEELVAKLTASGLSATVCDLFADPEAVIHNSLTEIGESPAPAAPQPSSLADLSHAIEKCLQDHLSPLEVLTFAITIVLCC
jgi:hypothetical protein